MLIPHKTLNTTYLGPSGKLLRLKPKNNKLIGKTLDLKISHKKKIYPNQIRIIQWIPASRVLAKRMLGTYRNGFYDVQDTVTSQYQKMSYYEIARYYLGKSYKKYSVKANRISVPTFQIVSNPTIKWGDVKRKKFDILGNVRRRMWEAEGLTEEQMKTKEQELKDRPYTPDPDQGPGPECILYDKKGEE